MLECLRFTCKRHTHSKSASAALLAEYLDDLHDVIFKTVQEGAYPKEVKCLHKGRRVDASMQLKSSLQA